SKFTAGKPYVTPQHHGFGAQELHGGVGDAVGDVRVEVVGDLAPDVVGLEAVDGDAHGANVSCVWVALAALAEIIALARRAGSYSARSVRIMGCRSPPRGRQIAPTGSAQESGGRPITYVFVPSRP